MDATENTKQLVVAQCRRVIELIDTGDFEIEGKWIKTTPNLAELSAKMAELRRDTIRLEKQLRK